MSHTLHLNQEFYQQRQDEADTKNSQELIEANHVGWRPVEDQIQGFEIATDLSWIIWQEIDSVLDVGCGYGRLLEFLSSKKNYGGKYWGIDVVPEFIEKATQTYDKKLKNRFLIGNFLEQIFNVQKFDVVISLGGLSINYDYPQQCGQRSMEYAQRMISKIVKLSRLAIILYFPNADNADNVKPSERKDRLAFYKSSEIKAMLLKECGNRCQDITFISYPDKENIKTISQVKLSH